MSTQEIKLAVDAVVFGYTAKEGLKVLLIKRKIEPFVNEWALPGGLVENDEKIGYNFCYLFSLPYCYQPIKKVAVQLPN